ncbi:MAG: UMP kinase [Candidatus Aenigmatarchaeota archaeon]
MDIILSLGGSLIVPDEIDTSFLKRFRELIFKYTEHGHRFIIISGGGKTCRRYQRASDEVGELTRNELDWIGIHSTRLNARLMHAIFKDAAYPHVVRDPTESIDFKEKILIAAGWKPGWSTDYVAVMLAKTLGVKKMFNLTNVDQVCDKDPKYHKDAKPIENITWPDFRKLVGDEWDPGLHAPFDPVAAKEAEKLGLEVIIINGKKLENLDAALNENTFKGTRIK